VHLIRPNKIKGKVLKNDDLKNDDDDDDDEDDDAKYKMVYHKTKDVSYAFNNSTSGSVGRQYPIHCFKRN